MKNCTQCGRCCLKYGGDARLGSLTAKEMERLEDLAPHAAEYVYMASENVFDIWVSPRTRRDMPRCPWLRKLPKQNRYVCTIYGARPDTCRGYPHGIGQMIEDGCEMIDPSDLCSSECNSNGKDAA